MPEGKTPLRKRIAPSAPLKLTLTDDTNATFSRNFRLCFDFNAITLIEETTGFGLLTGEIWKHLTAKVVSVMFWAAVLAVHEEYEGAEGLAVIRSYMDAGNVDTITDALIDAFLISLPKEKQERLRALKEAALKGEDTNPTPPVVEMPPPETLSHGESVGPSPAMTSN
jgi:hypothetical protein